MGMVGDCFDPKLPFPLILTPPRGGALNTSTQVWPASLPKPQSANRHVRDGRKQARLAEPVQKHVGLRHCPAPAEIETRDFGAIANPKPISETAVRSHAMMVRSTASLVRNQAEWSVA